MKTYRGNITITKENYKEWREKLKSVENITGYLYINSQVKLDNLKSIGGNLSINSQAKLDNLKSIGGYLSINSQAKLDNLKSVSGDLYIYSQAKLEAKNLKSVSWDLYINSQAKLDNLKSVSGNLSINSPIAKSTNKLIDRLIKSKQKRRLYINNVEFEKSLFNKVRRDELSASQVFSLKNIEQRRIAYEIMDKAKMKKLKSFKVLDKKTDKYGHEMKIVVFKIKGFEKEFKYLNCICPSTQREYFLETQSNKCQLAKARSFGLEKVNFIKEY